jgi:uncharacterized membrane protein YqgA involved in biofilm formation
MYAVGLVTLVIGFEMALKTENILIPLSGILTGGMIGHALRLEKHLDDFARALAGRFSGKNDAKFAEGFITASLIFCVGPMTILGSLNDGLSGDYHLLSVKSVLDGFTSMALASGLGIGVLFSVLSVAVIQGGITLSAGYMKDFFDTTVIMETTAAGGLLIIAIGFLLLNLKKLPVANYLPALLLVPLLVKILQIIRGI